MILLRIVRRRTLWESCDIQEVYEAEFRTKQGAPDLNLSVFEIEDLPATVVQAHAEHCASAGLDPPSRGARNADVAGLMHDPVVTCEGMSRFAFTRNAHREVQFANADALLEMVTRLVDQRDQRRRDVVVGEIRAYVRDRLGAADPEWIAFRASSAKRATWDKWLSKDGGVHGGMDRHA